LRWSLVESAVALQSCDSGISPYSKAVFVHFPAENRVAGMQFWLLSHRSSHMTFSVTAVCKGACKVAHWFAGLLALDCGLDALHLANAAGIATMQ
jgi:hypothetical protein